MLFDISCERYLGWKEEDGKVREQRVHVVIALEDVSKLRRRSVELHFLDDI